MARRTLPQMVAAIFLAAASPALAQVAGLEFADDAACRVNEIPLGAPARIEARRVQQVIAVKVAANFGCAMCAWVICASMPVFTAAGVTQFTRMPVFASSLPSDFVSEITPAFDAL